MIDQVDNPAVLDTSSLVSGFTEGSVIFVDAAGTLHEDNPNFIYNDAGDRLEVPNVRITNFTEGSVIFVGPNGDLTEDNTNFFFNNSTDRLGIKTNSPSNLLHVAGTGTDQALLPDGSVVAGNAPGIAFNSYADTGIGANGSNLAIWESGTIALNLADILKQFRVPSDYSYSWSSATNNNAGADTTFTRNAAGVIQLGVGASYNALIMGTAQTTTVPLRIVGIASQSADFTQWQNNLGTVIHSIGAFADGNEVVWNEQGDLIDFRVEGDTDTDLLLVDASADQVQIGKLNINLAYTFPTADGSADEVLTTDGAGNVTFSALPPELWTDGGTFIHPTTTTEDVIVGGNSLATADIFLGDDGAVVLNEQGNSVDTRIETAGETNMLLVDGADNTVYIAGSSTGTVAAYIASTGEAVFNQQGNSVDFRVEGSTDTDLLLVDGSADQVQIGKLNINLAYTFPTADGGANQVLQTDGAGNVTFQSINESLWTDGGAITYLTSTTDDLAVGGSTSSAPFFVDVSAGSVTIDGLSDSIHLLVQGHSTQTTNIFVVEKSNADDLFRVDNDRTYIINQNDTTSNEAIRIQGNSRATAADGDEAYFSLNLTNSIGGNAEFARLTWQANDVTNTSKDGEIRLGIMSGNSLTDLFTLGSDTAGAQTAALGNFSFDIDQAVGVGQDNYVLTYDNGTGLISLEVAPGAGTGEWTDTGSLLHPADLSGAEDVVIGGTTVAGADISLGKSGAAVFNEQGNAASDFRVESLNFSNMIFLDSSADRIGFGTGSPTSMVDIHESLSLDIDLETQDITIDDTYYTVKGDATTGNMTVTLPAASGATGRVYVIKKVDSSVNTVVIDGNASETIDGSATHTLSSQWDSVMIQCDGSNWLILAGHP